MVKIGLLGVGHLGKIHLENWQQIEQAQLVGFFDPNETTAIAIAEKYQIQKFDTAEALIAACDALDIVSPTIYHFDLCALALRAGKHVFVEKPLTHTMEEAKNLIKLAKESKNKFQVGHVERFNPAFLALKGYDLQPMFIEVHRLAQFNPRGTDVSVILDLMIHDIDIVLKLVKSNVNYISANGVAVMSDTPDIANVRIEFDNGCVANLTSSRISMKRMRKMRIFQRDAYIGVDFLEKKTEIIKLQSPSEKTEFSFDIETNTGKKTISIANPKVDQNNAIKTELELFVHAIINNTETAVTIEEGYDALKVAHQILDKINKSPK